VLKPAVLDYFSRELGECIIPLYPTRIMLFAVLVRHLYDFLTEICFIGVCGGNRILAGRG
jgi:hypothetical protein